VGTWGTGLYQDDDALDLRNRWRELLSVGYDARDVGRRLVAEHGSDEEDTVFWLVLADLLWRAGLLSAELRRPAEVILGDGRDLQRWDDPRHRRGREHVLAALARKLAAPMPPARPPRPTHPCDWRAGELIVWRLVGGHSAVLRVVGFDRQWGGGGSPVVELVAVLAPDEKPRPAALATAQARTALRPIRLASGRSWRGTRFAIGVLEPGTYRGRRLRRIRPAEGPRRFPKSEKPVGTTWNRLDHFLMQAFHVPWPSGTVLRLDIPRGPEWLVAVDVRDVDGTPGVVCEVLRWGESRDPTPADLRAADVLRTSDTIRSIRARVVDPGSRMSISKLRHKVGAHGLDERLPHRFTMIGTWPPRISVVGRRPVVMPTDYADWTSWETLGEKLEALRGDVRPADAGASRA
jgi:hypothetical protein